MKVETVLVTVGAPALSAVQGSKWDCTYDLVN